MIIIILRKNDLSKRTFKLLSMNTKTFFVKAIPVYIVLLSFSFFAKAQMIPSDSIASEALRNFQKAINKDNYKLFGLKSPDEIANMRLGQSAIHVYLVRLDSLRKFQSGDGRTLLTNINQVLYPVYSGDNLVSSISLGMKGDHWAVESFGDRAIVQNYMDALKNVSSTPTQKTYLIRIPSLNIFLLATENSTINVELLGNQPFGELKPGAITTLQDAFLKIKPIANNYNGLPW